MRSISIALAATAVSFVLAAPASPAPTQNATFCGGNIEQRICELRYSGGDVSVTLAMADVERGDVTVRLELRRKGRKPLVLIQCGAKGETGGCGANENKVPSPVRPNAKLSCVVEGRADEGVFACSTGL